MINYCVMQFSVWGTAMSIFMCWSVVFPFSFRQLKISGRIRYAHIISIALAVVIPLPAGLAPLSGEVVYTSSAVVPCLGHNRDYIFYSFILPVSTILAFTVCLLLIVMWILFKVGWILYTVRLQLVTLPNPIHKNITS